MGFPLATLGLFIGFLLVAAGPRTWIQWRRTGDTGDRRRVARRMPVQRRIDALAGTAP